MTCGPRRRCRRFASGTTFVLLIVAAAASPWFTSSIAPPSAAASTNVTSSAPTQTSNSAGPLRVAAVSPSVTPDGVWSARFDVVGSAPLDSTISVSVRQALSGDEMAVRAKLAAIRHGADLPSALQGDLRKPIGPMLSAGTLSLDVPIRSHGGGSDRVFVPNAGVHPVEIELLDHEGNRLQRLVLFLTRLPGTDTVKNPLQLALLLPVTTSAVLGPDSKWTVPEDGRRQLERAIGLRQGQPTVPVSVAPAPNLLEALAQPGSDADRALLANAGAVLSSQEVLRSPWAPLDVESWATSGTLTDLQTPLVAGQLTLTHRLGATVQTRTWIDDPTVGPGSLTDLEAVGVDRLVVDPSRLAPSKTLGKDPGTTRAFQVDGGGKSIRAIALDAGVASELAETDVPAPQAAHDAITDLQAIWFASASNVTPGLAVELDQRLPTERAAAFLATLAAGTPLVSPGPLGTVFDRTSSYVDTSGRRPHPLSRELLRVAHQTDLAALSTSLDAQQQRSASYHTSYTDQPGLAALDQMLLGSQDRTLTPDTQRGVVDTVARRIDVDLGAIQTPARRTFTVTSRDATLPIQINNALDRPVDVNVRFSGTRLEIVGGNERVVTLQPGITRLSIPVVARTSGQFTIAVGLRTVDRRLHISTTMLQVRSTAFSGVGLVLGGGALLFLAVWWFRSWRTGRRGRTREDQKASVA
jgi:hypothetical protein